MPPRAATGNFSVANEIRQYLKSRVSIKCMCDCSTRQECLAENWFLSLQEAEEKLESWRKHYNGERPHSALGHLSPGEFAVLAEIAD